MIKEIVKFFLLSPIRISFYLNKLYCFFLSYSISPNFGNKVFDQYQKQIEGLVETVNFNNGIKNYKVKFYIPNYISNYRSKTFLTKEPEMIKWINEYGGEGVFFDIGANIGLYSIYYAMTQKGKVYAFEPSVFNLQLLVKNINANKLEKNISIITNPITSNNQFSQFLNSNTDEGGALSTFGVDYGHDGKKLISKIEYQTLGFSLDHLIENKIIPDIPEMIKIDVDGIEHLILNGASTTLKNNKCKTIFIEVSKNFKIQSKEIQNILTDNNFKLQESFQTSKEIGTYNQIWSK